MDEATAFPGERPKKSRVHSAVVLVAMLLLVAGLGACGDRQFSAEQWKSLRESNYRGHKLETLADTLVDGKTLIGMSEKELFDLLGPSDLHYDHGGGIVEIEWCVDVQGFFMTQTVLALELDSGRRVEKATVWTKNM